MVVRICSGAIQSRSNVETRYWPWTNSATYHWYRLVWEHSVAHTSHSDDNRSLSTPNENQQCSFSISNSHDTVSMSWICSAYPARDGLCVWVEQTLQRETYSNEIIEHGPFEIPIEFDFFFLQDILIGKIDSHFRWPSVASTTFAKTDHGEMCSC